MGAADLSGKRQPYSAGGAPSNRELLTKPDILAYDELDLGIEDGRGAYGTSLAAPFAAGLAATALSAGIPRAHLTPTLQLQPGRLLSVPTQPQRLPYQGPMPQPMPYPWPHCPAP